MNQTASTLMSIVMLAAFVLLAFGARFAWKGTYRKQGLMMMRGRRDPRRQRADLGAVGLAAEAHVQIAVDALHQQVEFVGEEVIGTRDRVVMNGDVTLGAQLVDQLLDARPG